MYPNASLNVLPSSFMSVLMTEVAMETKTMVIPMTDSKPEPSRMPRLCQMGTEYTWQSVAKPATIRDELTRSV